MWGCTNPLMRKGTKDRRQEKEVDMDSHQPSEQVVHGSGTKTSKIQNHDRTDGTSPSRTVEEEKAKKKSFLKSIFHSLMEFRHPSVFLPYLVNQSGSIMYYKLNATSSMTTAIPACNALTLVFSSLTSYFLGERLDKPFRAFIGALLVSGGVILCMISTGEIYEEAEESVQSDEL